MSTPVPSTPTTSTPAEASSPAVRCRGLVKEYGTGQARVHAVRSVDLDVPTGALAMLVGPSGCGKTTLISLLAGILDPTEGTVEIHGVDPAALGDRARADWRARDIGFVFQQFHLLPSLTAAENAAVSLMIRGVPWDEAVERASAILVELGLGERLQAFPRQLSGGQQQRVAVARALAHEPRLVVCDEPTSALDHATGERVVAMLRNAAVRSSRAVVVVTHDDRIFSFADRIVSMDDGRVTSIEDLR